MNLLDIVRDVIKSKPILFLLVFSVIGCLFGWWVMGYLIWPVQYVGEAHTYELADPDKQQYILLVADSYTLNGDTIEVEKKLAGWGSSELSTSLADVAANLRQQGNEEQAQRVEALASAVAPGAVPTAAPADVEAPPSSGTMTAPPPTVQGISIMSVIQICIGLILILIVIAAILFIVDLRRRKPKPEKSAALATPAGQVMEMDDSALGHFRSTYVLGDDNYDESFSLETKDGEFLGECGIGISESLEAGPPDKITAFEAWLFDKNDIKTVTKVLMSEFAFNEAGLRDKLAPKGDAVLTTEGQSFTIETDTFVMEVRVTGVAYGAEGQYPNSYFENLSVELIARLRENTQDSA